MTTILIKKRDTAGAPTAGDLTNAAGGVEIAVNTSTKRVYSKDSGGNIIELGTNPTSIMTGAVSATQVNITGQGDLRLEDTTGGEYVALQAPISLASSYTLTLPIDDGVSGQALITDGNGNLSWSTAASGDVYGPASSTNTAVALFDGVTGKLLKNSGITVDGSNNVGGVAALTASGALTLSSGVANGVAYLNGSKVLTTGSALTFDGASLNVGGSSDGGKLTLSGAANFAGNGFTVFENSTGKGYRLRIYQTSEASIYDATTGVGYNQHVWKLGGSEYMRLDVNGNLGIGTSSPVAKLVVNDGSGSESVPVRIQTTTAGGATIGFKDANSPNNYDVRLGVLGSSMAFWTLGSQRMTLDSSGNLGLGVTPSAWGANYKALQIGAKSTFYYDTSNTVVGNNSYDTGGTHKYLTTAAANLYVMGGGSHVWYTAPSGTAGNAISFTQAMTLDASGNLTIQGTSYLGSASNNNIVFNDGVFGTVVTCAGGIKWTTGGTTERMRIDSSGNVGIGTSSPDSKLHVAGTGSNQIANFRNTQSADGTFGYITVGGAGGSGGIIGQTNNATASSQYVFIGNLGDDVVGNGLRVYRSSHDVVMPTGNLLVGGTSTLNAEKLSVQTVDANACVFTNTSATGYYTIEVRNKATTGDRRLIRFMAGSTPTDCGAIYYNGSSTVYATSSDYRLKENVVDLPNGLDAVLKLKPRLFTWKDGQINDTGFIAHELQEVFPKAVQGEKDAVDEEGNPVYQGIDTSFLVATLTKAIQELKAELDATKAEVAALKGV